jgi:general secretion pathway protein L
MAELGRWRSQPTVTIRRDGETIICRLTSATGAVETRLPRSGFDAAALAAWLAERGLNRDEVIAGPAISGGSFFVRDLSVPKAALGALTKIIEQEMARRTPFQLSDIWHAATVVAGGTNDVVAMCHWIIRKARAEAALAELGLKISDVDFLAAIDANGDVTPVISLRTTGDEDPPWAARAVRMLAAGALVVVLCGLAAFEWSQASVAASIETELAEARQGAQTGRDGIDPAGRLLAMKADAGILELWDELSRILPDHTFLTEFRMADGKVTVSGFSTDAARLVRTIDASSLFSGAALMSAITPDATEHKDRFTVSFKVRGGRMARPPATGRSASR